MSEEKQTSTRSAKGPGPRGHAMGMPVEKAKDVKGTLKRLIQQLKPRKVALIVVMIFAALSTVFSIVGPRILGMATDALFDGFYGKITGVPGAYIDFSYIGMILLILLGLYLISSGFSYIVQWVMASVAQETVFELRENVSRKLSRLPLKFYDGKTHGEILSRVTNDLDNIANTLQQSLTQLITAVVALIGAIVMMISINPLLTAITMVTLPLSIWVTAKVAKYSQQYFKAQQKVLGDLNGHIEEIYSGHAVVKAFTYEEQALETFETLNTSLYHSGWKSQFLSGIIMPAMNFINNLGYVLVCVVGGVLVTRGSLSVGNIQAFIQYARQFGQPIVQTANIASVIQSTIASAERVFEILDETEQVPDHHAPQVLKQPQGEVVFEQVAFGYEPGQLLMNNLNLHVKKGQTVAIVGPTGAGKTTLVNLLMRFYELESGRILVDGMDIKDMRRSDLRHMFGMVLQDTWLFKGTLAENIGYASETAEHKDIVHAAKLAHADHFIRTLPEGYDTVLNEDASNISQGQKQLLTIARAILANPSIMILDEATSSVDTRTEVQIQHAMKYLMHGRTNFVIAHRLSTIKDADLILVMDQGDIIEQGTHDQLLAEKGFYYNLYNAQFAYKEHVS